MSKEKLSVYKVFIPAGIPEYTRIINEEQSRAVNAFLSVPSSHLLIHGPSKTGKTTLWNSTIGRDHVIKIPCTFEMSLIDLYAEIIDELNVFFDNSSNVSEEVKTSFAAELKAKVYGLMSGGFKAELSSKNTTSSNQQRMVTPSISSRNIAKYIKLSDKLIVIENIHYASEGLRRELSRELHNFSDYECKWVLVGVQHEADALFVENRDLVGRLNEIQTGYFTKEQIYQILKQGEDALNVVFDETIKKKIYDESFGVAALVQDIALNLCLRLDVLETQSDTIVVNNIYYFEEVCRSIAAKTRQVYSRFCADIINGGRSDGTTEKYLWFLKLIKEMNIPKTGLLNTEVYSIIKTKLGHDNINQSSVTQGLIYTNRLQEKKNISPPVMTYDDDQKRLYLIDPYFKFALRWIPELLEPEEYFEQE